MSQTADEELEFPGIQIVMFDSLTDAVLCLGGMKDAASRVDLDWAELLVCVVNPSDGATSFLAEKLSPEGDILEDCYVSAELVVAKLGEEIAVLISRARQAHHDEFAQVERTRKVPGVG